MNLQAGYKIYSNNHTPRMPYDLDVKTVIQRTKTVVEKITGKTFSMYNVRNRKRESVFSRQLFCFLIRRYSLMSLNDIGNLFCYHFYDAKKGITYPRGFDHSTVINSIINIENSLECIAKTNEKEMILLALKMWR